MLPAAQVVQRDEHWRQAFPTRVNPFLQAVQPELSQFLQLLGQSTHWVPSKYFLPLHLVQLVAEPLHLTQELSHF